MFLSYYNHVVFVMASYRICKICLSWLLPNGQPGTVSILELLTSLPIISKQSANLNSTYIKFSGTIWLDTDDLPSLSKRTKILCSSYIVDSWEEVNGLCSKTTRALWSSSGLTSLREGGVNEFSRAWVTMNSRSRLVGQKYGLISSSSSNPAHQMSSSLAHLLLVQLESSLKKIIAEALEISFDESGESCKQINRGIYRGMGERKSWRRINIK